MKDDFTARVIRSLNWLQYGTNFLWVLIFRIFAIFPGIRKNRFPPKKIPKTFFPQKFAPESGADSNSSFFFSPIFNRHLFIPFSPEIVIFPHFHPPRIIPVCQDFSWAVSGSAFDRRCVDCGPTPRHLAAREKKPLDTRVRIQVPYNWLTSHL